MQNDEKANDKIITKYISVLQEKLSVAILRIAELEAIVLVQQEAAQSEEPLETS
jgi:hypothetical protein